MSCTGDVPLCPSGIGHISPFRLRRRNYRQTASADRLGWFAGRLRKCSESAPPVVAFWPAVKAEQGNGL